MSPEVYEFYGVRVDLRRIEVSRDGETISLEPKTFDVLRFLIEHRDRLVTKDELLDTIWKDTFVTPNVLTRAVAQLRKALGDDAFEARYIETASKRGYRFIAPITVVDTAGGGETAPAKPAGGGSDSRRAATRVSRPVAVLLSAVVLAAIVGAVAYERFRTPENRPSATDALAVPALTRLTTGGSSYTTPAISPDGRDVAYASDQTGSMEIYVTRTAAARGKELAITHDGQQNLQPAWSPDGQWLAFYSRLKGGIWVVESAGGVPRQVADFGSQPSWSPSGDRIVFSSYSGLAVQSVLWTVGRDGTGRTPLTKPGDPAGGHQRPTWSHDGRFIVFTSYTGNLDSDLWLIPAGGGEATSIGGSGGGGGVAGSTPRFSPNDRAVYWAARTPEGNDGLARVSLDERGAPTGQPAVVLTIPGSLLGGLSIALDSTAVAALSRGSGNLWAVDVAGDAASGPPFALTTDEVRHTFPNYSPDGKRVAFHESIGNQRPTSWIIDEDGKNREPLSPGLSGGVMIPQFSPDGGRVLVRIEADNTSTFFVWLDLATRQASRLPSLAVDSAAPPRLSPDGAELAYQVLGAGGAVNVWAQRLDGGAPRQVTFGKGAITYPSWSPDGKWLAVEIKRGDGTDIGVISRDGGPVEQITSDKGQSWPFSWAPDNDRIAFAGERDGVWNIYFVSRRTRQVKRLTNFASPEDYVNYPAWSPSGRRIVFERAQRKSSLWTTKLP